jgi:hemerythrin-like metal-binding protein
MSFDWTPDLATGSRQVDDQHVRLFQLCSELQEAVAHGQGQAIVSRTLNALAVYVVAHFRLEEDLMRQGNYPGLEGHGKAHAALRAQVEEMVDQYRSTGVDPTQVLRFLNRWLLTHIQEEDRAMARYLAEGRPRG